MAILPVNPNLLDVSAISAQQASNDGSPFLFTSAFSDWNEQNAPTSFYVLQGGFFIVIDDYRADVVTDYENNWM